MLRGLLEESAGFKIEQALVSSGSIAAHQVSACREAMAQGDVAETAIPGLARGMEDNADIHHDVDKQRILGDERAYILPLIVEAVGHRAARINEDLVEVRIAREPIPAVIRGQEDKPEVVRFGVTLAGFERLGV